MRPILYNYPRLNYNTNGYGVLHDCVTCFVEEERNGVYELTFTYPVDGLHYEDIALRAICKVKPNKIDDPQLFRIYSISKPLKGIVTVKAAHISYDLSDIPVSPFSAVGITQSLALLKSKSIVSNPFTFTTDLQNETTQFNVDVPKSVRSCMGGSEGSLLDAFGGGEYKYNNYTVQLLSARGSDNGVTIKYGKNLTQLKQDENSNKLYSAIYPYWVDSNDGTVFELSPKTVPVNEGLNYNKILAVDFSGDFEEKPTAEQLTNRAENYISANGLGRPDVSLTVSFEQLEKYDLYESMSLLEQVLLCDTVTVVYEKLGVSAKAKIIKYKYDCLKERVDKITIGNTRVNMSDAFVGTKNDIKNVPGITTIRATAEKIALDIMGANGGSIRFIDTNEDGEPDTLYVADDPDPNNAVKVWRWNYQGWAASSNGYNGPFTLAASLDSGIFADFITAGTLDANLIRAGVIQSALGEFWMNLEDGTFSFGNDRISYDGSTLNITADSINLGGNDVATNESVASAVASSTSGINQSIDTLRGEFEDFADEYNGFITIEPTVPAITLGKTGEKARVKITSNNMILSGSGNATAELGNSKFSVSQVETNAVILGTGAWEVRSNGHISLKKVSE